MRIALRTSGGRGEYELAGSHGEITVSDAIDLHLMLQLFPGQALTTNNWVRRVQGKPRIRLSEPRADKHIYLLLADALLMPKPKRELGKTPGGKLQLTENNYSVTSIKFDVIGVSEEQFLIQPIGLVLENSDRDAARLDVLERLRIVLDIWAKSSMAQDELSVALQEHRAAVREGDLERLRSIAAGLRRILDEGDPLREILRHYALLDEYTYWMGIHAGDVDPYILEETRQTPGEARRERVRQWRLQASRGSQGARFSREVKEAYQNRCLFTGYHLPKSSWIDSPGVDSAHILPWAEYGINTVKNGICLNKLCHWAFDTGVLVLTYSGDHYELTLSDLAREAESASRLSLEGFAPLVGRIPNERLPRQRTLWPSPEFLAEYNSVFNH